MLCVVALGSANEPVPLAHLYPQRKRNPKGHQEEDGKIKVLLRHNWGNRAKFLFILKHAYVTRSLK